MPEPQFVSCLWLDAWADAHDSVTQADAKDKHKATLMETLGWLLVDDEAGVSLFSERCLDKGDEMYRSRTFIPRQMIKSVTPYNLTKPRKARPPKPDPIPPET
jgi:hypothetical protein